MKIELLANCDNGKGRGFMKGTVVDWPRRDAQPLVLSGLAREPEAPAPKPRRPRRRYKRADVDEPEPEQLDAPEEE